MNKSIIIVGAGPGLSAGVAEKFGNEGFTVGLISRNEKKLAQMQQDLRQKNITAYYTTADAYRAEELGGALRRLSRQVGRVDVLHYNAAALKMKDLMEETSDALVEDFKISTAHAFHSVKVLLEELKSAQGAILLTGGVFATNPSPAFGSLSLGKAALRNLAYQLHGVLQPEGVYVGTMTIDGYIQSNSETHSPKVLAEKFWEMYRNRTDIELRY